MSLSALTETLSVADLLRLSPRPGYVGDGEAEDAEAGALCTFRDLDDPSRRVRLRGLPARVDGVFTLTLVPLHRPVDGAPARAFGRCVHPWLVGLGGELLACWIGESAVVDAPVIAWLTRFGDEGAQRRHAALLDASGCLEGAEWRACVSGAALQRRLVPTAACTSQRRLSQES
jgi:hypothetical protein